MRTGERIIKSLKGFFAWIEDHALPIVLVLLVAVLFSSNAFTRLSAEALTLLVGVLAGAVPVGLSQWYAGQREERRWLKQQQIEDARRQEEYEREEKERVRGIYQNSMRALSEVLAGHSKTLAESLADTERLKLHRDAVDWITRLQLHQRDQGQVRSELRTTFAMFRDYPPSQYYVEDLYNLIVGLALDDPILYPGAEPIPQKPTGPIVTIHFDEDYRRQQFQNTAQQIPQSVQLSFKWEQLSTEQRQKLADMYFRDNMPRTITFQLPDYDSEGMPKGKPTWRANLNPEETTAEEFFAAWETDYDSAVTDARPAEL